MGNAVRVPVIMLGSNDANGWADAAAVYENELRALITAYKTAFPDAKIILVTSPPTLEGNAYGIRARKLYCRPRRQCGLRRGWAKPKRCV